MNKQKGVIVRPTSLKIFRLQNLLSFGYLWLPLVTFGYLTLPLVTFPGLTEPFWARANEYTPEVRSALKKNIHKNCIKIICHDQKKM